MSASSSSARSSVRLEWLIMLLVIGLPLVGGAVVAWFSLGDQAAPAARGLSALERSVTGLLGVLPLLLVLAYVIHLRAIPLDHLGLQIQPARRLFLAAVEGLILFALCFGLLWWLVNHNTPAAGAARSDVLSLADLNAASQQTEADLPRFLGMVGMIWFALVNGSFEELFRGYLIRRTADAWGSLLLGAALSVLLFAAYHCYYDSWRLGWITAMGVLFALYYLWRRNLLAMMLAHILLDLATFLWNDLARAA